MKITTKEWAVLLGALELRIRCTEEATRRFAAAVTRQIMDDYEREFGEVGPYAQKEYERRLAENGEYQTMKELLEKLKKMEGVKP